VVPTKLSVGAARRYEHREITRSLTVEPRAWSSAGVFSGGTPGHVRAGAEGGVLLLGWRARACSGTTADTALGKR
jgi:hypothetical protein